MLCKKDLSGGTHALASPCIKACDGLNNWHDRQQAAGVMINPTVLQ
jgi:hypothetical protein